MIDDPRIIEYCKFLMFIPSKIPEFADPFKALGLMPVDFMASIDKLNQAVKNIEDGEGEGEQQDEDDENQENDEFENPEDQEQDDAHNYQYLRDVISKAATELKIKLSYRVQAAKRQQRDGDNDEK